MKLSNFALFAAFFLSTLAQGAAPKGGEKYYKDLEARIEKSGIKIVDDSQAFLPSSAVPDSVKRVLSEQMKGSDWESMVENPHAIRLPLSDRTELYAIRSGFWERDQRFLYVQYDNVSRNARLFPFPFSGVEGMVKEGIFGHAGYDPKSGTFFLDVSLAHFSERTLWAWNEHLFVYQFRFPGTPSPEDGFESIKFEEKLYATHLDFEGEPFKVIRFAP